jgi:hypothetical protein
MPYPTIFMLTTTGAGDYSLFTPTGVGSAYNPGSTGGTGDVGGGGGSNNEGGGDGGSNEGNGDFIDSQSNYWVGTSGLSGTYSTVSESSVYMTADGLNWFPLSSLSTGSHGIDTGFILSTLPNISPTLLGMLPLTAGGGLNEAMPYIDTAANGTSGAGLFSILGAGDGNKPGATVVRFNDLTCQAWMFNEYDGNFDIQHSEVGMTLNNSGGVLRGSYKGIFIRDFDGTSCILDRYGRSISSYVYASPYATTLSPNSLFVSANTIHASPTALVIGGGGGTSSIYRQPAYNYFLCNNQSSNADPTISEYLSGNISEPNPIALSAWTIPTPTSFLPYECKKIFYNGDAFVAVGISSGLSSTPLAYSTTDAFSWSRPPEFLSSGSLSTVSTITDVIFAQGKWLAVAGSKILVTLSKDGSSGWSNVPITTGDGQPETFHRVAVAADYDITLAVGFPNGLISEGGSNVWYMLVGRYSYWSDNGLTWNHSLSTIPPNVTGVKSAKGSPPCINYPATFQVTPTTTGYVFSGLSSSSLADPPELTSSLMRFMKHSATSSNSWIIMESGNADQFNYYGSRTVSGNPRNYSYSYRSSSNFFQWESYERQQQAFDNGDFTQGYNDLSQYVYGYYVYSYSVCNQIELVTLQNSSTVFTKRVNGKWYVGISGNMNTIQTGLLYGGLGDPTGGSNYVLSGVAAIAYISDDYTLGPILQQANDIAYGNNQYVAVGIGYPNGSSIATSSNGISGWVGISAPPFPIGNRVRWNGTVWLAGGTDGTTALAYSSNGYDWSPADSDLDACYALYWNGTVWMAGGTGVSKVVVSTVSGQYWASADFDNSLTSMIAMDQVNGIGYDGNKWIVVGSGSHCMATTPSFDLPSNSWSLTLGINNPYSPVQGYENPLEVGYDIAYISGNAALVGTSTLQQLWLACGQGRTTAMGNPPVPVIGSADGLIWSPVTTFNDFFSSNVTTVRRLWSPYQY